MDAVLGQCVLDRAHQVAADIVTSSLNLVMLFDSVQQFVRVNRTFNRRDIGQVLAKLHPGPFVQHHVAIGWAAEHSPLVRHASRVA